MEIAEQFDWEVPEWIIIPGGNLGNVSALGKGLLEFYELGMIDRLPRIVCAQAQRANPLYLSYLTDFEKFDPIQAQPTLASAIQIGNPVSLAKAVETLKRFNGIVEQASEQELPSQEGEPALVTPEDIIIHEDGSMDLPLAFVLLFGPEGTRWIKEMGTPIQIRFLNGNPRVFIGENMQVEHLP